MATSSTGGMAHPTAVPENFDPERDRECDDGPSGEETGVDERSE